ncbi:hypothetical protein SCLCIDRAFT_23572 [Scleroderma citrinum Foug A]|uniref:Uncharacterized protein n=1 Tax=Scleroderma citrinum Foug A TaxID=1036808 RepID=A0A0C3AH32_9AGAM|nr:hypothetical protein SCLCIDRAFT_23572 [Scleroderma citrinum Foug A]
MSDMPSTQHYVVPVKLPNSIDTYTRSDNKDFVKAFKDALGSIGKTFINHCYARSCNLLVDIPLENYMGILSNSLHAVPPDYQKYVKEGIEWDPHWGYNIFHMFLPSGQNSFVVNWFKNPYLKAYLHATMNPMSKGWFGIAVYSQDVDSVGMWRVVSQPNLDFAMLMIALLIVDLTADILCQNVWDQHNVTSARMQAVVQTLVTNGIIHMGEDDMESLAAAEWKEFAVFCELLKMVPGLESCLMESLEDDIITISDLKGVNGAHADDTKECQIWQGLQSSTDRSPSLSRQSGLEQHGDVNQANDWSDPDPWNGLLWSGLLVSAFKHIFTSPSSVDQEPKATRSGNVHLHGMQSVTKASIAYIATQARFALTLVQVFSRTDLITNSERFYTSILNLLDDTDEKDEVDQLLMWWNRQIFPLYADLEQVPSKNSALARIRQKREEIKERAAHTCIATSDLA